MRDTIFIGHANPEDNEFTIWLYSKLELEGYKAWCDLQNLYGGERDFWDEIQTIIQNNTCKYLLVFSNSTFNKEGVKDEFEFARAIARNSDLKDFVIPLRIEDVPYIERIGINRYNVINFTDSWLTGLIKLLKKLSHEGIPKSTSETPSVSDWLLNIHPSEEKQIINRKEIYYSNWWPINKLPHRMYLFQYSREEQAQIIIEEDTSYPVVKHGNYLVSFEQNITHISKKYGNIEVNPIDIKNVLTKDLLKGYDSDEFPTLLDSQNLLKRLLKKAFKNLMYDKRLWKKEMAHGHCFYYPKGVIDKNKVTIKYHNRYKTKNLIGSYHDEFWHFGVSAAVRLEPFVCYSLKSHLVFSDKGYKAWDSDARLHSARRAKGKRWFNEEWRDQLMAFIHSLVRDEKDGISIKLSDDFYLRMPLLTKQFYSDVGYMEPRTPDRLDKLHEDDEELFIFDEPDTDADEEIISSNDAIYE